MLKITIPSVELWDERINEFVYPMKEQTIVLEHSLVSISKWEMKYGKTFLNSKERKTEEETLYYVQCMTLTQNVDPKVYKYLTNENLRQIREYIDAPMSATVFTKEQNRGKGPREQMTSELIYYWMIALNIPMECQKWHLNRLLTLIKICNIKNQPAKKRSRKDTAKRYAALNAARRKQHNSRG